MRCNGVLDQGLRRLKDPFRQSIPNSFRPALFLTTCGWQGFGVFSHQIRCDCPYVIGQIDIFREALDHPIGFGKGCSALENEVLTKLGTEEVAHSTEDGHGFHAIMGARSRASWAAIPRDGGQPSRRIHGVRLDLAGQAVSRRRRAFSCSLRRARGGAHCERADRGSRPQASGHRWPRANVRRAAGW